VQLDHEQGALREAKRRYVLDHMERWAEELGEGPRRLPSPAASPQGSAPAAVPPSASAPRPTRVLCIPASDRSDEIAAKLCTIVLNQEGFAAWTVSHAENRRLGSEPTPDIVLVSAITLEGVSHARHMCRRALAQFKETAVIVGLWHSHGDLLKAWQRLESAGATRLVTTFVDALAQVNALALELQGSPWRRPLPANAATPDPEPPRVRA
jgi:hypothetical protein